MTESDTTRRFTDRVEQYRKYRPGYPAAAVDCLVSTFALGRSSVVADIGAGTGIFTRLLLPVCGCVYAVEPNDAMRTAMDSQLAHWENYRSIKGTSSATGLEDHSIDCITAAQAFHWFNREQTLPEFRRIARPGCCLAILFNDRQNDTPFLMAYEDALQKYAGDYSEVTHKNIPTEAYAPFFAGKLHTVRFDNSQIFDLEGILGRLSSSSYCPKPGDPNHKPLWDNVTELFERYNVDGNVELRCPTTVYWGRLA